MESDERGIEIAQGQSVLADVQAKELELERVLEEARGEAGAKIERAKAQAGEQVREARAEIDRQRRLKVEAIVEGAKAEAEAMRQAGKASLEGLRAQIESGVPRAVEETVRAILPDGFLT